MKYLHVQNIDASDTLTEKIDLPSIDERKVASLTDSQGESLIDLWFDGDPKMFNSNTTEWRNRASFDKYPINTNASPRTFTTLNGYPALDNPGGGTPFGTWSYVKRRRAGDWTVAFAGILRPGSTGTNYSIFGVRTSDALDYVNQPSLNITSGGVIRSFSTAANTTTNLFQEVDKTILFNTPIIITVSQSVRRGFTLRINKAEIYNGKSAAQVLASTGKEKLTLMFGAANSAVTNGQVGTILLMNDDISDKTVQLETVEKYLANKVGV